MTEEQKAEIREKLSWVYFKENWETEKEIIRAVPSDNPDYFCVDYITNKKTGETSTYYWRYDDNLL